jgi:prolipoprotein diacylglyceryltransferase
MTTEQILALILFVIGIPVTIWAAIKSKKTKNKNKKSNSKQ